MRSQVLRISQVLQEYLQFARMPRSERAALSLRELLEERLGFVQPLLDQKQVGLNKIFDPDLPARTCGRGAALGSSLKFNPQRGERDA